MATTVADCVAMMEVLAPGFRPTEVSLDDVSIGVAWLDGCDPLVRERIQEQPPSVPVIGACSTSPFRHRIFPRFMAEVARDVHGEALRGEPRPVDGGGVADKVEDCLAITRSGASRQPPRGSSTVSKRWRR